MKTYKIQTGDSFILMGIIYYHANKGLFSLSWFSMKSTGRSKSQIRSMSLMDALQMPTAQFKYSSQAVNCPFTDTAHTFY